MSVGFGVFMGIIPLWGFQMLIAIAVSIFCKLNKALVLIAANISFPPLIPFILYLSHETGRFWMGKNSVNLSFEKGFDFATIHNSFMQYVSGAITLAFLAGLFFGLLTYLLLKVSKRIHKNG